jgi:hypothetical protein
VRLARAEGELATLREVVARKDETIAELEEDCAEMDVLREALPLTPGASASPLTPCRKPRTKA